MHTTKRQLLDAGLAMLLERGSAIPGADGSVLGVPLAGGAMVILGPDRDEPGGIATNGETVCWTTMGSGRGNGSVKCLGICNEGRCA